VQQDDRLAVGRAVVRVLNLERCRAYGGHRKGSSLGYISMCLGLGGRPGEQEKADPGLPSSRRPGHAHGCRSGASSR
jgi:hypothetical protein